MSHDHHDDHAHHEPTTFWSKYVFSTDHKIIGMQFLFTSLLFVILGGLFALGVRYQIAWPGQDVPYRWILPGDMTDEAPESNLALWKEGGRIALRGDIAIATGGEGTLVVTDEVDKAYGDTGDVPTDQFTDGMSFAERVRLTSNAMFDNMTAGLADAELPPNVQLLPEAARGKFLGFNNKLAVTVPKYTRLEMGDGSAQTLDADEQGYIDPSLVMGGYNPQRQDVVVVPGTEIEMLDGTTATLVGEMSYLPPTEEGGKLIPNPKDDVVSMPIRRGDTLVNVRFPEQTVALEYAFSHPLFDEDGDQTRDDWAAERGEAQIAAVADVLEELQAFGLGMQGGVTKDQARSIVEELILNIPDRNLPYREEAARAATGAIGAI